MKKVIASGALCALMVLGGVQYASAETTTPKTQAEMLAQIQELMKLITSLQEQIKNAKAEIQELAMDLDLGAENEDVRKAQEILASDSSIFNVKPTGYFGPLTQEAIKKFQERYGLEVTGKLDEATREVMKELRKERKDGMVPPGLIKSEEVKTRIKARLQEKWGDCEWGEKFRASDCKKGHDSEDEDEDSDDNSSDDEDTAEATRAEAEEALGDAREAISDLKLQIEEMEDDDADEDDIDDAEDTLADAQKKLADARRAFVKGEYDDAVEKAEEVVSIISGDDEDDSDEADDESDDEDEDSDDDSSDDEDDSDEAEDDE